MLRVNGDERPSARSPIWLSIVLNRRNIRSERTLGLTASTGAASSLSCLCTTNEGSLVTGRSARSMPMEVGSGSASTARLVRLPRGRAYWRSCYTITEGDNQLADTVMFLATRYCAFPLPLIRVR